MAFTRALQGVSGLGLGARSCRPHGLDSRLQGAGCGDLQRACIKLRAIPQIANMLLDTHAAGTYISISNGCRLIARTSSRCGTDRCFSEDHGVIGICSGELSQYAARSKASHPRTPSVTAPVIKAKLNGTQDILNPNPNPKL